MNRSKRIHVRYLGEVFSGEEPKAALLKADTAIHKGDLLTKEMSKPRFEECKELIGLQPVAIALYGVCPKTCICRAGKCLPVAVAIAAAATLQAAVDEASLLEPGRNSWGMDSGSGNHLVQKKDCTKEQLQRAVEQTRPLLLATANGLTKAVYKVPCYISQFRSEVWAWLMISSPKVLSMHCFVKEKQAELTWLDDTVVQMKLRGDRHYLPVVNEAPLVHN